MPTPDLNVAPPIRIFLRDEFQLKADGCEGFLVGVDQQLRFAHEAGIRLIAACSERPFDLQNNNPEPPPPMMHIWEMPEWRSLYDAIYASSESIWYEKLEDSIADESQELLIDLRIAYGSQAQSLADKAPKVYVYEEMRFPGGRVPNTFQRALNSFSREVAQFGWTWLWCCTQVTATQRVLCLLWSAPTIVQIEQAYAELRGTESYRTMMSLITALERRYMYPTFVEALAARL